MHKYVNKILVCEILRKLFVLCIAICLFSFFPSNHIALAQVSGSDKLYGETLTQREMSVGDCPSISASYACLMTSDGKLVYERNSNESAKIASMTKIMTAIIALENSDMADTLVITKKAVDIGESSAGFWVGDKLDMKSALYALMVPSGNDAAEAICEHIGNSVINNHDDRIRNKSEEDVIKEAEDNNIEVEQVKDVYISDKDAAFCKLMNDKATDIGCTNTFFSNPHGLDDGEFSNDQQHSCASDMAMITRYAMQNSLFRTIVSGGDTTITVNRDGVATPLKLTSTDALLGAYHGCIGVKTGHTDLAGSCFSGAAVDDGGTEIYTIVMHSESESQRFIDTQSLFDWYFTHKVDYKVANSDVWEDAHINDEVKRVCVLGYVAHSGWVDCTIPVTVSNQNESFPVLSIAGNVYCNFEPLNVSGNYKAGDKVAEIVYSQHNKEIYRTDLIALHDQYDPNLFQVIGVGIDRFFRNISGQQTVAQTTIITKNELIKK